MLGICGKGVVSTPQVEGKFESAASGGPQTAGTERKANKSGEETTNEPELVSGTQEDEKVVTLRVLAAGVAQMVEC